jgi:hypothetical protein
VPQRVGWLELLFELLRWSHSSNVCCCPFCCCCVHWVVFFCLPGELRVHGLFTWQADGECPSKGNSGCCRSCGPVEAAELFLVASMCTCTGVLVSVGGDVCCCSVSLHSCVRWCSCETSLLVLMEACGNPKAVALWKLIQLLHGHCLGLAGQLQL